MFKILFILHLPPPVHGASMMGKYLHDSKLINETFECKYINLTTAKSLQALDVHSFINQNYQKHNYIQATTCIRDT